MFDVKYTLDYLEAMALVKAGKDVQKGALNKIENTPADKEGNVENVVRPLTDAEWNKITLNSIDDFVKNGIIPKRDNAVQKYQRNGYMTDNLFSTMYGTAETTKGAPGGLSFRLNAFELLAYKGYYGGFIPYASNQLHDEAVASGDTNLSDRYIIKKVSNNQYQTYDDFRIAMFKERINKLSQLKPISFRTLYSGKNYTITSVVDLEKAFDDALQLDIKNKKLTYTYSKVKELKMAIYNAYLRETDEFRTSIYK